MTFPNQTKEEKSFSLCVDACTLQSLHIPGHIHTHTVTHPFPTVVACFATFCCVLIFTSLQFFFSFCECLCDATIVSWNESFECIACLISICADNWYKSVRAINKVLVDTIQVDAMKLIAGVVFFFDSCSKWRFDSKNKKIVFRKLRCYIFVLFPPGLPFRVSSNNKLIIKSSSFAFSVVRMGMVNARFHHFFRFLLPLCLMTTLPICTFYKSFGQ